MKKMSKNLNIFNIDFIKVLIATKSESLLKKFIAILHIAYHIFDTMK